MRVVGLWAIASTLFLGTSVRTDSLRLLEDDQDAFAARLSLIQSAERTIHAAYYFAGNDRVTDAILAAYRDAARRGVEVRLILDAIGDDTSRAMRRQLERDGVEVRIFHPLRLRYFLLWTHRLHDKLMVKDGTELITGGRNIGAAYFGMDKRKNYLDRDVFVVGTTAGDADRYFDSLWNSSHVCPNRGDLLWPKDFPCPKDTMRECQRLDDAANRQAQHACPLPPSLCAPILDVSAPSIRFLHTGCIGRNENSDIAEALLSLIDASEEEILIVSPYLKLTTDFLEALGAAIQRGVKVRIVTNSLASTDVLIAYAGYANQKRHLLRLGIELYEYHGPACLHTKTWVIDDQVIIGSYNSNGRSESLDSEVAIYIEHAGLAQELRSSVDIPVPGFTPKHRLRPARSLLRSASLIFLRPAAFFLQHQL